MWTPNRLSHSSSLGMSYWRAVIGRCWSYTPKFWHTEQIEKFTEKQPFALDAVCPKSTMLYYVRLLLLLTPTNEERGLFAVSAVVTIAMFSNLPATYFCVPWNPCLVKPRNRWQLQHSPSGFIRRFIYNSIVFSGLAVVWQHFKKRPNQKCPLCDDSCSSPSQFPTPFPLGADFGSPPITWVLALLSALKWPKRPQRKHSLSVLLFSSTFSVAFIGIIPRFGEDFRAFSDFQKVQFIIFIFRELLTTDIVIAGLCVRVSHHHWSGTTGAAVDDCDNVCPHLCIVWMLPCCQLILKSCGTIGEKNGKSCVFG